MEYAVMPYNKYDIYIFLLIASLAFGGIGGALTIVRLLGIILFPSLMIAYNYSKSYIRPYLICFSLFYVYCVFSLIWTPDKVEGLKQLVYYPIHFIIFIEILAFSRLARKPLSSISYGWLTAVCITFPVAIWEFATDHHLSTSRYGYEGIRMANIGGDIVQRHFAAATFTNLNSYVTFLCFAMPFLLYCYFKVRKQRLQSISIIVMTLITITITFMNGSRGGFLSILIMSILFLLMTQKDKNAISLIVLSSVVGIIMFMQYEDSLFAVISFRTNSDNLFSGESRFIIWGNAWKAFLSTYGLGAGIGGMTKAMEMVTKGITATHNMFLELLLQYGIVFFFVFVYYILVLARKALEIKDRIVKTTLYMVLLAMPIYLIINSGYLLEPIVFAGFASFTAFADYEHTQLLRKALRQLIQSKRNTL